MFLLRYLGSLFYDVLILITLFFTFTAIVLIFRDGVAISPHTFWYQFSLFLLTYAYYAASYKHSGQTIGMRAWKIKLIATHGSLTQKCILHRFGFFLPAVVWAFFSFKNPDKLLAQWTGTKIINHVVS